MTDLVNGDSLATFVGSSSPSAIAGYASIIVPAGYVGPLPVGVSFIGGRLDEGQLIGLAYDFEQATHVRVPPQFIPSIGRGSACASSRSTARSGRQFRRVVGVGVAGPSLAHNQSAGTRKLKERFWPRAR